MNQLFSALQSSKILYPIISNFSYKQPCAVIVEFKVHIQILYLVIHQIYLDEIERPGSTSLLWKLIDNSGKLSLKEKLKKGKTICKTKPTWIFNHHHPSHAYFILYSTTTIHSNQSQDSQPQICLFPVKWNKYYSKKDASCFVWIQWQFHLCG